ncbi:MAG TPA: hypothetical protein VFH48_02190 [Chloroflexota bacterium]|nr:hypothetical protein [Chloroflexota bacterium]
MAHDDALHKQAVERGDYADETLYDQDSLTASLIHFADGSHGVRLDLPERGISMVIDTPAWLDLDTVLSEISEAEPVLGNGYVTVEREHDDDGIGFRVTVQGGDVVARVSLILLEEEIDELRVALETSRDLVEAADTLDHEEQIPALKLLQES